MALTPARTMPGVLELLPLDQIAFQRMLDVIRRSASASCRSRHR
jgi:histidyl-tRNA synthetase